MDSRLSRIFWRGRGLMSWKDIPWRHEPQRQKVLFFAAPLYEDLELWYRKIRLEEEGAATTVAGLGEKTYQGKRGYPITVDTNVDQVSAAGFDGLVIPGGFAPDQLRRYDTVLRITREIYQAGKPLA